MNKINNNGSKWEPRGMAWEYFKKNKIKICKLSNLLSVRDIQNKAQ